MRNDCLELRAVPLTIVAYASCEQLRTNESLVNENRVLKEEFGVRRP